MTPPPAGVPSRIEVGPGVWVALAHTPRNTSLTRFTTAPDRAAARQLPPQRRAERLRARGLLRTLLRDRFPAAAAAEIGYTPSGRPVLLSHPRVGISVSHVADACAVGVALDRAVGVDIQSPPQDVSDQLLQWCVPARRDQLAALPPVDRAREFTWMWTVKEACGKAIGTGLAGPAFSLDVPPGTLSARWGDYCWVSLRNQSVMPLSCAFSCT